MSEVTNGVSTKFTTQQICQLLQGNLIGNSNLEISNLAKIQEAKAKDISFISNPKYLQYLPNTEAGALVVSKDVDTNLNKNVTYIQVDDPYLAFTLLLNSFNPDHKKIGIDENASVSNSAKIGENVFIGAFSFISEEVEIGRNAQIHPQVFIGKNVKIGENTVIHPGVRIYENCEIAENCIIHSNTVIGSDGFGFAPQKDGSFKKIPQLGNVVIQANVEIGSNSTIDRATMGSTLIKKGVKIDNLVQLAHNVEIGENTVIAAQTGISGSTKLGKNCIVGGQVGFAGHIEIADGSQFGAQSGVLKSIKEPFQKWNGSPAIKMKDDLRNIITFRNLSKLEKRIQELEKQLKKLKD